MDIPQKKIARRALIYSMIFLVMLLPLSLVQAQLPDPEVTFIPNQVSAESSFVMIADPGSVGGSLRITWVTDEGYGHFPYIDGKYMCYFSDTDFESTCGPSPFRFPTTEGIPYLLDLFTYDSQGNEGNASVDVDVGGLKIVPDVHINFDTSEVIMLVYTTPSLAESVKYRVFDSEFDPKTSGYLSLDRITGTPYYNGSIELDPGVYYIAFKANSSNDYGGGIIKVTMAGGGDGVVPGGVLQADPINIDVLVEAGTEPNLPQNKRIINTLNQSFTGITISLPANIAKYLSITIPNASIGPYESVYYTMDLHGISSSLDINTNAEIKSSGGAVLGRIPIDMRISYTSTGITDCSELSDGAYCLGGICCGGVCREKAECCVDSDCSSGTCSSTTFRCEAGTTDIPCTTGTCRTDVLICPIGDSETGTCISGGVSGICCSPEAGECTGESDLTPCSLGICCSDVCVDTLGTECCLSIDCPGDELCENNMCVSPNGGGGGGIDFFSIGIIIAIIALAGLGGWWFFKKYKKKSPEEEEFGGEEPKEDEGLVEGDEEFY